IEGFNEAARTEVSAGSATGFTLEEQIYVTRRELASRASEGRPKVTTRLRVSLFWLGREPMVMKKDYTIKLGAARVPVRLEEIHRVIDASDLASSEGASRINRHDVAECTLKLNRAMAFDLADQIAATSRFVIVEDYEIRGGGIIREDLPDRQTWVRNKVLLRNYKWERSMIPPEQRARQYSQKSGLLLVTGANEAGRKRVGKDLETRLFAEGRVVYYLGIGNVVYGVDADIERKDENRGEHLRRLAEVANIMLDAGVILVVTAADLTQEDLEIIKTTVDPDRIETIWVGDPVTTDLVADIMVTDHDQEQDTLDRITRVMEDKGMIFRPW
ncbi:MAG: elongation factor 1-alpha C-terminal domain-related protein, partial [Gemmatimonadales bacterium]